MKSLRIGVIGVGSMGKNHARVCSVLPNVDLTAVVDINKEAAEACAKQYNTAAFCDYKDLYGKVDAAIVVSPTKYHHQIAKDLLEHDIHVLVEKPITVSVEEADELIKLAAEKKLTFQVGHLERFNPAVIQLQKMIRKPVLIEVHRLAGTTLRSLDVGIVWDLMIHDFDILLSFYRSEAEKISALGTSIYSDHEDVAHVQIKFKCGAAASLVASRNSGERRRCLKITEDDGRVFFLDFIEQTLSVGRIGEDGRPLPAESIEVVKDEPLKLEIASFAESVLLRKTPVVTGEDGRRALELAVQVMKNMDIINMHK